MTQAETLKTIEAMLGLPSWRFTPQQKEALQVAANVLDVLLYGGDEDAT